MIGMHPGGRFTASGVTLRQLINQAYNVRDFQVTNRHGWIAAERYDVNAKAEGLPDRVPPEQLRPMLRALLAERFQLKVHTETKEMPVYALVQGKNGTKLTPSKAEQGRSMMRMGRGQLNGTKIPMKLLTMQLAQQSGRSVIDKTELKDGIRCHAGMDAGARSRRRTIRRTTTARRGGIAGRGFEWTHHLYRAPGATGSAAGVGEGPGGDHRH